MYRLTVQKTDLVPEELLIEALAKGAWITPAHNPCLPAILKKTFGWKGWTFLVLDHDTPVGWFPVMAVNGKAVSMPHFSYGGLVSAHPHRKAIAHMVMPRILSSVRKSMESPGRFSGRWEIRDTETFSDFFSSHKVTSYKEIPSEITSVADLIPDVRMRNIRRAAEHGLVCRKGGPELVTDFYSVYAENMHRLGSPVLPFRFFADIIEEYSDGDAEVFCVYYKDKPIGGAILLSYAGFFENCWFSTIGKYNHLHPTSLLHHEMLQYTLEHSGRIYSFGRSTEGSGVHHYKTRWETKEIKLCWNYSEKQGRGLKDLGFLRPVWKLLPLGMANTIGPVLAKRMY